MDWPPVSACLLSWKRPDNVRRIIAALESLPFIDEILVWNNDAAVDLVLQSVKTRVLRSPENVGCLGRFHCAGEARNPIIYVQDDDSINPEVTELYRLFLADPTRVTHAMSRWHFSRRLRYRYGDCQVAFLGWGAFFMRDWIRVLDQAPATTVRQWMFRREADKFFSILLERDHHAVLCPAIALPGHSAAGQALWREDGHRRFGALAVREALRMVRLRKSVKMPVTWNVTIPCHNYGRYLRETVESVLDNDADYEITIVDDASSDQTPSVAAEIIDRFPWIRCVRSAGNRGAGWARNHGVSQVDSVFAMILDADDRIGPDYLHDAEEVLRQGADVANPDAILFGNRRGRWPAPEVATLSMLLEKNRVHCCSGFRRSYWAQVGGFDEAMPRWEDYEFWLRLAAAGARIHAVRGDHFYYRKHGGSRSSKPISKQMRAYIEAKHRSLFQAERTPGHRLTVAQRGS